MRLFTIPTKILNFRLFLLVVVTLCLGITSAYFFVMQKFDVGIVICIVFLLCAGAYLLIKVNGGKPFKIKSIFCLLFVLVFVFGNLSFTVVINDYKSADLDGHYYSVTARIKQSDDTDSGSRLLLDTIIINGNRTGKLKYKAYAYVYGKSDLKVGDMISFSGKFADKDFVYEGGFASTDIMRGVKYMIELSPEQITILKQNVLNVFERVNLFIRDSLMGGLDEREFSLAYALLTGRDEFMDFDLLTNYRNAGVAHVFAVSGLHIGFLAFALGFLFDKLKINKLLKAILITATLIFYSGVCGFSASSIRATIMVAVSLFLAVKGLRYDALSSLSLSAIIILLLSPEQLFFVGFQLSFAVAFGIVLLAKPIANIFKFLPKKFASVLGTVLSAHIVSIPISLLAFKQFSTIAIIANLVFIPIISLIFVALLVVTILGGVFGVSSIALFVPNYVLKFVNTCICAFDYNFFIVSGITIGGFAIIYYAVVLLSSDLFNLTRVAKLLTCLSLSVIFALGVTVLSVQQANTVSVHVIGSEKICATAIATPQEKVLIVSSVNKIYSVGRLKRLKDREGIAHFDKVVILNCANNDEQVFLTKLHSVVTFEKVYYFGERKPLMEQIVAQSFNGAELICATDGQKLTDTFNCCYRLDGLVADIEIAENRIVVFGKLEQNRYSGLYGKYDLTISIDVPETVGAYYGASNIIGYRANTAILDGESQGTKTLRFN